MGETQVHSANERGSTVDGFGVHMEDRPGFTIEEFQTRNHNDEVFQHRTFDKAYALFNPSYNYFKISYGDAGGKDHRWLWKKKEAVWVDRPIVIETKYDSERPYFVSTDDEIERLTDEEFRAKHH